MKNDWIGQDVLKLSVDDWKNLLYDENIFKKEDIEMVLYVYYQNGHKSTATDISIAFGKHHVNCIKAQVISFGKRIYKKFQTDPPLNTTGGKRYWNSLFDCSDDKMRDGKKHWYWVLRPNLAEAIRELLLTSDIFDNYTKCDYEDEPYDIKTYLEGESKSKTTNHYNRNSVARVKCIEIHGAKCKICGFDFSEVYGSFAKGKIQVHHIIPLSAANDKRTTNPDTDLIPVCPNCHYIIHLKNPPYSPEEVKKFIQNPV